MISHNESASIARAVASNNYGRNAVEDVLVETTADSEGRDALRVTIVLKPDAVQRLEGDALLDTLVGIHRKLDAAGEQRLPIVEYATREELDDVGDP